MANGIATPVEEKEVGARVPTPLKAGTPVLDLNALELLDQEDLINLVKTMVTGVFLNFYGKRSATEIAKRVRPRVTRRIADLHVGKPEEQARNWAPSYWRRMGLGTPSGCDLCGRGSR